jgi:hypothetical protein
VTKKSDLVRIRTSLEQTRVNLKDEQGRLSRERKLMEAEDTRARAALRLVCSQFGDLDWDETTPLSAIVTEHLATPLRQTLGQVSDRLDALKQRALAAEAELAGLKASASTSEISHALPTQAENPSTPPFMAHAIERAARRTALPLADRRGGRGTIGRPGDPAGTGPLRPAGRSATGDQGMTDLERDDLQDRYNDLIDWIATRTDCFEEEKSVQLENADALADAAGVVTRQDRGL